MSMARNVEWKIICFIRGSVSFYSIQYVCSHYTCLVSPPSEYWHLSYAIQNS